MNISTETVSPYQPYQAAAVSATAASSSPQGNSVHPAIQSIPLLQHVFQYTCDVQRPLSLSRGVPSDPKPNWLRRKLARARERPTLQEFTELGGMLDEYFGDLPSLLAWTDAFMGAELPVTA